MLYESDILDDREETPSAFNQDNWLNNLYVFEKLTDKIGANVILLGSKSGRFTGEFDDLAYYEWDGGNLQCFHFGRKGSGKSVGAMQFANQMNFIYGKPILAFDRAGEYLSHNQELKDPLALRNLAAFGLKPLGFGDRHYNFSAVFLGNDDVDKWGLDLTDFFLLKPDIQAKDVIEKMVDISGDNESDMSKYDAARRYLDQALNMKPRTFEELFQYVQEINESLQQESRKSKLLEANLLKILNNGYVTPKHKINFKDKFKKGMFLNFVTSLKMSKFIPLQVYEGFLHYIINQWKKADEIPQVAVISDEHDLVASRSSEKNFLKEIYQKIATKERKLSNIYYKITQLPDLIDEKELQQADFMLTTKPRSASYAEVFKWINEDEQIRKEVMTLRWDDTPGALKEHMKVTNNSCLRYSSFPSWSQYHKEKKQIWLVKRPLKDTGIAF